MNDFATLDWWDIAGRTMLHYLWIGALVGVAAMVIRRATAGFAPRVRYIVALFLLAVVSLTPVGIAAYMVAQVSDATELTLAPALHRTTASAAARHGLQAVSLPSDLATTSARAQTEAIDLAVVVRWLPWVWIVGTPLTLLFIASGLYGAERMKRGAVLVLDGPIARVFESSAGLLRLSREVAIAISDRVVSPLVIGVLRPVILLPAAAIGGWSPAQLEMILLHELAHVRRWDNFVNLVQRIVEAVLFYQPAIWFVSNWVRLEREHCCDDTVLSCGKEPQQHAETLASLAMPGISPQYAAAALASHQFVKRIRHILKVEERTMTISRTTLVSITAVLLLAATLVGVYAQQPTAEPKVDNAVESADDSPKPVESNNETKAAVNAIDQFILHKLAGEDTKGRANRLRDQLENLKRTYLELTGSVPDELRALESRLPNTAVVSNEPQTPASKASEEPDRGAADRVKRYEDLYIAQLKAAQEAVATAKQTDPSAAHDEYKKAIERGLEWLRRHQQGCTGAPAQTNCASCHQGVHDGKANAKPVGGDTVVWQAASRAAMADWLIDKSQSSGAAGQQSSERDKRVAQLRQEIQETESELAILREEVELEQARVDKRHELTNLRLTLEQMRRPENEKPAAVSGPMPMALPMAPAEMSELQKLRFELDRERSAIAERNEIEKLKQELQLLRSQRQAGVDSIDNRQPLGPDGNPTLLKEKPRAKPEP